MLDIKLVREHPEEVKQNILNRRVDPAKADVDKLLLLDARKNKLTIEVENLRAARNVFAEELKDAEKRTPEKLEEGKKIKEGIRQGRHRDIISCKEDCQMSPFSF